MTQPPNHISDKGRGPLPIVFGITGHRDLRLGDMKDLEKQVGDIIQKFARKHRRTPLTLLSPLAEGADRLVARVALSLGIHLIVPMPLAKELYERDFETPASRAEFHSLLERASQTFDLPLLNGYTERDVQAAGDARNHHYAQVGAYIARHSHILIALWDGQKSDKIGGTAQVVKFKLEGIPEPYGPRPNPLDPVDSGPVYHIVTPRVSNPQVADALQERWLFPSAYGNDKQARKAYRRIFSRIEIFNRDAVRCKLWPPVKPQNGNSLFAHAADVEELTETAKGIGEWFTVADRLALRFQGRDLWALQALVILAIAAAVVLQVPSGDVPKWASGCLLVLSGLCALALWQPFHNKYLDYRALAEGLRVQLFWWLAGIHDSVADHYLRKQRSELDWIRQAIRMRTVQSTSDIRRLQRIPLRSKRNTVR